MEALVTFRGHSRGVAAVAFSGDGECLATGGADSRVNVWHCATGELRVCCDAHDGGINGVCWTRDSAYVASASDDKTVRLWNAHTGALVRTFVGHTSYVLCVACHPLSTLLVSAGFDETIRLWDVQRGTCHRTIAAHSESIASVDVSGDGSMIASCAHDGLIRLWDTSEGHCLRTLQHADMAPVSFVRFSPSSLQLLTMSLDSAVRLWDVPNARVLRAYTGHVNEKYALAAAFVATSERVLVAAGSEDRRVHVWDAQTGVALGQPAAAHRDVVIAVCAHPVLPLLATAALAEDASAAIWRVHST